MTLSTNDLVSFAQMIAGICGTRPGVSYVLLSYSPRTTAHSFSSRESACHLPRSGIYASVILSVDVVVWVAHAESWPLKRDFCRKVAKVRLCLFWTARKSSVVCAHRLLGMQAPTASLVSVFRSEFSRCVKYLGCASGTGTLQ